jgi:two-component system, NtrC family, response regulator HydG
MGKKRETILIVDDSLDTLEVLQRNLKSRGYSVVAASRAAQAIKVLESTPVSLVITDIRMPEIDGYDLIRHVQENFKGSQVLAITGFPSVQGAVRALKIGAEEYLVKPFTDEELSVAVEKALKKNQLRNRRQDQIGTPTQYGLIGESAPMCEVYKAIEKAAASAATVLIQGESGTGKELVARAIHYSSKRASQPFVPVNCGSIPEQLLESELFGHMKGAFTGAATTRAGFFQTADKGTIFLDEISEASLAMQVKLLRVLQEKEVYMLGSNRSKKVDVRIVAATNRDLYDHTRKGLFREDLFYRLNVFIINVPPLRETKDDIMLLVNHFIGKVSAEFGRVSPRISEKAMQVLMDYHWPGNVRELENVMHRLVAMAEQDIIDVPDLPSLMRFSALRSGTLKRTLAEVEHDYIQEVLVSVGGNKTVAARLLGIDRKTLRKKLQKPLDNRGGGTVD